MLNSPLSVYILFTERKYIYKTYKYVEEQPQLLIYFENRSILWLTINESYNFTTTLLQKAFVPQLE